MGTSGTSTIRFSGLASGLDTDSIVTAMLLPYKNKVTTAEQNKELLSIKKDTYRGINTKLLTFRNNILDKMKLESTYNKKSVSVSNPSVISINDTTTVPEGTHTFKVQQMASGATVSTQNITRTDAGAVDSATTRLSDLGITDAEDATFKMSVAGKSIEVELSQGMTIKELQDKVNEGLVTSGIDDEVYFQFDEKIGSLVVASSKTGKDEKITLSIGGSGGSNAILDKLGINAAAPNNYTYAGQDAEVLYNGGVPVTSSTNELEIKGFKFNITSDSQDIVTVTSKKDTEGTKTFIKSFVEEYNKLIEEFNTLVDAPRNKSYRPLTGEQKEAMSESEIEDWEQVVKGSILSGDDTLSAITDSMRLIVGSGMQYGGKTTSLSALGITTGNWEDKGKLIIDEDKLDKALSKDPDKAMAILTTIGKNLNSDFQEKMKGTKIKSSQTFYNNLSLDKSIEDKGDEIEKLEDKMSDMEKFYYAKFTAMEKMMSQLNTQSSSLTSLLGGN